MIGSVRGVLAEVVEVGDSAAEIVIDVGGVGYRVSVTTRTLVELGSVGTSALLAVHTHVRDAAITLYGFASAEERKAFEILIATHGVGPALALALLGVHPPSSLARVVEAGDIDSLMLVPGIGRKTAARLVVELAGRLPALPAGVSAAGVGVSGSPAAVHLEVGEALGALGFSSEEVRSALQSLPAGATLPEGGTLEEMLRIALQQISRRR